MSNGGRDKSGLKLCIEAVFQSHLTEEELEAAVSLWMNGDFDSITDVPYFIAELAKLINLRGNESDYRIALRLEIVRTQNSNRLPQSRPIPIPETTHTESTGSVATPPQSTYIPTISTPMPDRDIVFNTVLDTMVTLVNSGNIRAPRNQNCPHDYIASADLHVDVKPQLQEWMKSIPGRHFLYKFTQREMSLLIQYIYTWLCESQGPTIADEILEKSIREAETLKESNFFNPRTLL